VRIAVVGHVEWLELVSVDHVPQAGEIVHARPVLEVAAGGGAVAAVQLARWGAETLLFTAFGAGALGDRARSELIARGVQVHAVSRAEPQRRAVTLVDADHERTIVVVGDRMVARAEDPLPWDTLATCDAVYVTGGDIGAIREARRAPVMIATSRILCDLRQASIELDALVGSDSDLAEAYIEGTLPLEPRLLVRTVGAIGVYLVSGGTCHRYAPIPAPVVGDTYGAGDTFAAALTFALGERKAPAAAIAFASARAAEVVAFHGPYP
jgi:ribokinase